MFGAIRKPLSHFFSEFRPPPQLSCYVVDFPLKHENQDRDSFNWLKLDIDIVRKKRQNFLILGKNPDPAESRSFMKRFDANFA